VLLGLLALVRAAVDLAEAEVAVGDQGAHHNPFLQRDAQALGRQRALVPVLDAS
jgi:hypothetical protein